MRKVLFGLAFCLISAFSTTEADSLLTVLDNSAVPTKFPSKTPSKSPLYSPTKSPSVTPSFRPTVRSTTSTTIIRTASPSIIPTLNPSKSTTTPSSITTLAPSKSTTTPSTVATTLIPSTKSTTSPSIVPTLAPSKSTTTPSITSTTSAPSSKPTIPPSSLLPSPKSTVSPSVVKTAAPSSKSTISPSTKAPSAPTTSLTPFQSGVLSVQNAARAATGKNEPALTWDTVLAPLAEQWAANCVFADSGTYGGFQHGSNAAAMAGYTPTGEDCAQLWVNEKPDYSGRPITADGSFCNDGNADGCGHYTQVVWKTTTSVGCGMQQCNVNSPFRGFSQWYLCICFYSPPGNYLGQTPY